MRICYRADADVQVKNVGGQVVYETEKMTLRLIRIWQAVFPNASFFFSKEDKTVCEDRIRTNQSDVSSEFYSCQQVPKEPFYFVPVPDRTIQVSMLTGYDLRNITRDDVASAIQSLYLFQGAVYWAILGFLILFTSAAALVSYFKLHRERFWIDLMQSVKLMPSQALKVRMRRQTITRPGYTRWFVWQQVQAFLRDPRGSLKWIGFLFNLLVFYLSFYFNSVYSTSSIVEDKPPVLNSYAKLAKHPSASAHFLNWAFKSSESFENAPATSLKGKIWLKFIRSPLSKRRISIVEFDKITEYYKFMRDEKYVFIGPSHFLPIVASGICAFSGEDELRTLQINTDPLEDEQLFGFPVAIYLKHDKFVVRRLRLLSASLLNEFITKEYSRFLYELAGSHEKRAKQRSVCTETPEEEVVDLPPVHLNYWTSFFYASLGVLALASIILLIEHLMARVSRRNDDANDSSQTWRRIRLGVRPGAVDFMTER